MNRVVIVGAGLAGVRCASALRRNGYSGDIDLLGDEADTPYDRPPLSKTALVAENLDEASLALARPDELTSFGWRPSTRAVALDTVARTVRLADGTSVDGDAIVIATGSRARVLPQLSAAPGVYTVRSLADTRAVRAAAHATPGRAVVVGGGFIGAETAWSLIQLGWQVTIVEPQPAPLARGLGLVVGAACAALMTRHGAELLLNTGVAAVANDETGAVTGVVLDNGANLDATLVVVGVGSTHNDEWLAGSGLAVDNGVAVDRYLFTGAEGIFAAGDVARIHDGSTSWRHEHWTAATEHADVVAHNLLHSRERWLAHDDVPYVWSDQFGVKLQMLGRSGPDVAVVDGDLADDRRVVAYGDRGPVVGVVGSSRPRVVMQWREKVLAKVDWAEVDRITPG